MKAHELEFMFNGSVVGYFDEPDFPRVAGQYHYMPYRGPAHYMMAEALRSGVKPRCHYDENDLRVSFVVRECPAYGTLNLDDFGSIPKDISDQEA
jgi:hypothetical protein